MLGRGTKYSAEIAKLRKAGFSDGQIAERLSVGKSIVHRNLYEARTMQRLAKLMTHAKPYALKHALVHSVRYAGDGLRPNGSNGSKAIAVSPLIISAH